jgi:preprotein translocase subunit SecF
MKIVIVRATEADNIEKLKIKTAKTVLMCPASVGCKTIDTYVSEKILSRGLVNISTYLLLIKLYICMYFSGSCLK